MGEALSLLEQKAQAPYFFDKIPDTHPDSDIIMGTEHELGTLFNEVEDFSKLSEHEIWPFFIKLPGFIENGGRIYGDMGHVEMCTPETRNPVQTLIYEKAMERICELGHFDDKLRFADELYKNNRTIDSRISWGAHENYYTRATRDDFDKIIPFLVTRQIMTGAGFYDLQGIFQISQRSEFITQIYSDHTTKERGLVTDIGERNGEDYEDGSYRRVHFILNEGNMCEGAILLKLGTMKLVLNLLEDQKIPSSISKYDLNYAIRDVEEIGWQTSDWQMRGLPKRNAIDIQNMYLEAAAKNYAGRDKTTDILLHLWNDTLKKLKSNPTQLLGRVDWITKKIAIEALIESDERIDLGPIHDNDLAYHNINRKNSLFYWLKALGVIESYLPDRIIEEAMENPPTDTRAFIRGNLIKRTKSKYPDSKFNMMQWYELRFPRNMDMISVPIPDPFHNYEELFPILPF